jgi:hypothetical protein
MIEHRKLRNNTELLCNRYTQFQLGEFEENTSSIDLVDEIETIWSHLTEKF